MEHTMIRYRTKKDHRNEIQSAVQGDTGIYIMLLTVTGGNMTAGNYIIKHGNYSPATEDGHKESWDQFYITGEDEGYEEGFQTIADVLNFLDTEIEDIGSKKTESVLSNDYVSGEGVTGARWSKVLEAWESFRNQLIEAIENDRIITPEKAKEIESQLKN